MTTKLDRKIRLSDGRTLAYIEAGDPDGYPVVSNHGGLSSRLDVVPSDNAARAHGLRIISPDRPGIGRSDRKKGRTLESWAQDVGELVDRLDVERFAVMGWSFGGCYAQSVARFMADRVSALSLIASGIPSDWAGMREEINRTDRLFLKLSEQAIGRLGARFTFGLMRFSARRVPGAFARVTGLRGASAQLLSAAIAEGLSDTRGVVDDYQVANFPWGFDPSEITVPTRLWQGDADHIVPPRWALRLHEAIPNSTLELVPGATHFLWYDHWDEIFAAICGTRT